MGRCITEKQKSIKHIHYHKKVNTKNSFTHHINNHANHSRNTTSATMSTNNRRYSIATNRSNISIITEKHHHESALITAAHILASLTQDGKVLSK